jgi:hypothetical protein
VPALLPSRRAISFTLDLGVRLVLEYMPKWQTIAVDRAEREMYIEPWFMATEQQNATRGYIVGEFFCTDDRHTLRYVRRRVVELICKPLGRIDVCRSAALRLRGGKLSEATLRQAGVQSIDELREARLGWVNRRNAFSVALTNLIATRRTLLKFPAL